MNFGSNNTNVTGMPNVTGTGCGGSTPVVTWNNNQPIHFAKRDGSSASATGPVTQTVQVSNGMVLGLNVTVTPFVMNDTGVVYNTSLPFTLQPTNPFGRHRRDQPYADASYANWTMEYTPFPYGEQGNIAEPGSQIIPTPYYNGDVGPLYYYSTLPANADPHGHLGHWLGQRGIDYAPYGMIPAIINASFDILILHSSIFTSSPCNATPTQTALIYDMSVDRVVYATVSPSTQQDVCIAISSSNGPNSTYRVFDFTFPGQNISHLDFSLWGGYYTACWLDAATNTSRCYIFERERIINGIATPRVISVPTLTNSVTYPYVEVHAVSQQHSGTAGPLITTYAPCGVFVGAFAGNGNVQYIMCQSLNFSTSSITTQEATVATGLGSWNANVGQCRAYDQCIPFWGLETYPNNNQRNPFRNTVRSAYRYEPSLGSERMALAWGFDADGIHNAKIYWIEYFLDPASGLPLAGHSLTPSVYDPFPGNYKNGSHVYTPVMTYDNNLNLYMGYYANIWYGPYFEIFGPIFGFRNTTSEVQYYFAYRLRIDPEGSMRVYPIAFCCTDPPCQCNSYTNSSDNWFPTMTSYYNYSMSIASWYYLPYDNVGLGKLLYVNFGQRIKNQTFTRTFTATDACNVSHSCTQELMMSNGVPDLYT